MREAVEIEIGSLLACLFLLLGNLSGVGAEPGQWSPMQWDAVRFQWICLGF